MDEVACATPASSPTRKLPLASKRLETPKDVVATTTPEELVERRPSVMPGNVSVPMLAVVEKRLVDVAVVEKRLVAVSAVDDEYGKADACEVEVAIMYCAVNDLATKFPANVEVELACSTFKTPGSVEVPVERVES